MHPRRALCPAVRRPLIAVACASFVAIASGVPAALATTGTFEVKRLPGSTLPAQTLPMLTGPLPAGDGVVYAAGGADGGAVIRLVAPGAGDSMRAPRRSRCPPAALA
jgi:hypothetical protein